MLKKIIAGVLSLMMVIGLLPQTAFANESTVDEKDASVATETTEADNVLGATLTLKGATFFDDPPWYSDPTQRMIGHQDVIVPYDGWQLMRLELEIPYQADLEIKSVQPSVASLYPEYSKLEKDDKNSVWRYSFFFKNNGIYDFNVEYALNGKSQSMTLSRTVDGLVSIKDIRMRRHLIDTYGDLTGFGSTPKLGWYVDKDILATTLRDPWGNVSFDFGKDVDNGHTAENARSLDGLQYLTNIHGMYLFDCRKLAPGETIEPITKTVYPEMKLFRLTEITESSNNLPKGSYTPEMIADAIRNMPNLYELSISGTGFKDLPVIGELNGGLGYLEADYNEIESIEGIEKHPELYSISLGRNKIKSIEPFAKADLSNVTFLDLGGNQVFDLRPMNATLNKNIVGGQRLGVFRQTITYDKTVIANLKNDAYEIELPMPIDIDGALTDTDKVVVTLTDGSTKEYATTKRDGKTYISIPKIDVDSNKENPFENIKFSFEFNNKNGNDTRTKGGFSGTVNFKVSPFAEEYHVVYDFKSGTRGQSLPQEVTDLLPIDSTKYVEGSTINAIQPAQTEVTVANGVWTFKGYDADSKIANKANTDDRGNIRFTGTWTFEKKPVISEATVTFKIKDGTWADGTATDKTVKVALTDGKGTLDAQKVPTGMKANEGYEGGTWDVTPNTATNGITGNVTYTYSFTKKAEATVTFKIENGTWSDGSATDKTVKVALTDGKGTLDAQQVPTGMKANEGYEGGAWDVTPNTATNGITGNVTYTYSFDKESGGGGGGIITKKYTLTYDSNGGTEYKPERYSENKTVQLDKVPTREDYQFTGWYADEKCTKKITEVKMTSDKTVYAGWKHDVPEDLNGDDHIAYVKGYVDGTVKPNNDITRAETTAMLYRLLTDERREEIDTTDNHFSDVKNDAWYAAPVFAMNNGGYIAGYEDGTFGGEKSITRAEFVAMLVRFIGTEDNVDCTFSDVPKNHWAYNDIATATEAGWIGGYTDGTFAPNQHITRAEAMSIINRVLDRGVDANSTLLDFKQWPDNPKGTWCYYEIIEATNDHEYTGSRPSEDWTSLEIG